MNSRVSSFCKCQTELAIPLGWVPVAGASQPQGVSLYVVKGIFQFDFTLLRFQGFAGAASFTSARFFCCWRRWGFPFCSPPVFTNCSTMSLTRSYAQGKLDVFRHMGVLWRVPLGELKGKPRGQQQFQGTCGQCRRVEHLVYQSGQLYSRSVASASAAAMILYTSAAASASRLGGAHAPCSAEDNYLRRVNKNICNLSPPTSRMALPQTEGMSCWV